MFCEEDKYGKVTGDYVECNVLTDGQQSPIIGCFEISGNRIMRRRKNREKFLLALRDDGSKISKDVVKRENVVQILRMENSL